MLTVDIDKNSGFCAGVIKAISTAEEFLQKTHDAGDEGRRLYSLGAIVHNDAELSRLVNQGLVTIDKEDLEEMVNAQGEYLLIRAHGEPPQTYRTAEKLGFHVIDCTCPVVLRLQERIKEAYQMQQSAQEGQIIIFGKTGHAEVLGLIGQTDGTAIVVENIGMLEEAIENGTIKLDTKTEIFSQTTKSPAEYSRLCSRLEEMMADYNELSVEKFKGRRLLVIHDTICAQVAARHERLSKFALAHDIIIFVSGKASSNGKVLASSASRSISGPIMWTQCLRSRESGSAQTMWWAYAARHQHRNGSLKKWPNTYLTSTSMYRHGRRNFQTNNSLTN